VAFLDDLEGLYRDCVATDCQCLYQVIYLSVGALIGRRYLTTKSCKNQYCKLAESSTML
jgi:hypothetical protein